MRGPYLFFASLLCLSSTTIPSLVKAETPHLNQSMIVPATTARVSAVQFASEQMPIGRVDLQVHLHSTHTLPHAFNDFKNPFSSPLPSKELNFYSFFETDRNGDRSFDLDSTVGRIALNSGSYLWIGRSHPLSESLSRNAILPTSAIGTRWAQNQSNPLEPRVSGWLGIGAHFRTLDSRTSSDTSGPFITATYSPIFLPSFGPSIEFSETIQATGSRFARMPPSEIAINREFFPLHYRILRSDISSIILQSQYFFEIGHQSQWKKLSQKISFMAWSAPTPSPKIQASGILKVKQNEVSVLATVVPSFPREIFYCLRWQILTPSILHNAQIEAVYGRTLGYSNQITISGSVGLSKFFTTGYLTTLHTDSLHSLDLTNSASIKSPDYAENLFWFKISDAFLKEKLLAQLRVEQHLKPVENDRWIHANLDYSLEPGISIFLNTNLITGTDESYFGNWKAHDSVAIGGRYTW